MKPSIITLPNNRVRRNYLGGKMLDLLSDISPAQDSNRPEDWIASTIEARNPGQDVIAGEGLSTVVLNGETILLTELFAQDPLYYLGQAHYDRLSTDVGFLSKFLDSSMRLHLQAHPSAAFAQKHLQSQWGKLVP